MSTKPPTIRWGILATGQIAQTFAKDLLVDPKTRNVDSVIHTVVAASSSSGKSRAEAFLEEVAAPSSAKAYGSYEDFVHDPDIDIVYVATPHSHHYQNVMLCLEAGKNVLCEKAFTVNANQAKILVKKAREKGLFLMEALWTRYFPLSIYVRETITSKRIGDVYRVFADLSLSLIPEHTFGDDQHRMVNPDLAGGALLDLGIYSLTWCFLTLYHTQPVETRKPPTVVSAVKSYRTGVDVMTTMVLTFPRSVEDGGDAHAIATASMIVATDPDSEGTAGPSVRVQGEEGELQVFGPAARPTKTRLILRDGTVEEKTWPQPGPGKGSQWYNGFADMMVNPEGEGHGMFWEADEAALALVEGRKEGRFEGLDESVLIMQTMDEVRRLGGIRYPEAIESTEYPIEL